MRDRKGVSSIFDNFSVTSEEYDVLEEKFGRLCHKANHELKRKNYHNNITDDHDDIAQELRIKLLTAGAYQKRQTYIESSLQIANKYVTDKLIKLILAELEILWENRKRHGANRQKFGDYQELLLEQIIIHYVPKDIRPSKKAVLNVDSDFSTYCKTIVWNGQKTMGKKITKEKTIRSGIVSLSEFHHLG